MSPIPLFRPGAVAEESLQSQYSPDSEQSYSLTPPHHQEESEDESSFVSHTQHLVEVMEERIKQVGSHWTVECHQDYF